MFPLAELIRRCVEGSGGDANAAWAAFLQATRRMVGDAGWAWARNDREVDEFVNGFGGWLFQHGGLGPALGALRCRWHQPESEFIPEREWYAWNYLRRIVHCGRAEFWGENRPRLPAAPGTDPDEVAGEDPLGELADRAEAVRVVAVRFPHAQRIAFWLHYLRLCGNLLPADRQYLEALNGLAVGPLIDGCYQAALEFGHLRPFRVCEIGQLLRLPVGQVYALIHQAVGHVQTALGRA